MIENDIVQKTAVVTGAASGIGYAIAKKCVSLGMNSVLADIEEDRLLNANVRFDKGSKTLPIPTDVSKPEQVELLAKTAIDKYGAVHYYFACAGVSCIRNSWEGEENDWKWLLGVNLIGIINGIRTFVPLMLKQDIECHIVNTASVYGLTSLPGMGLDSVAKSGVISLSEILYHELNSINSLIKVSVLCPSHVKTNITSAERNRPKAYKSDSKELVPVVNDTKKYFDTVVENGIDADQIAQITFDALENNAFYIFPQRALLEYVKNRIQLLLEGKNPIRPSSQEARDKNEAVETKASDTARSVALLRAISTKEEGKIRGKDYLAEKFLFPEERDTISEFGIRKYIKENVVPPGSYEYIVARTAYYDQLFEEALKEDIPQIVILGSGYDSRAYRFNDMIKNTKIFEVDIETTQSRKQQCLLQSEISPHNNICFIPMDFRKDNLETKLLHHYQYDQQKKTLFLWEGVTMYLNHENVDSTLNLIYRYSSVGSRLVFDYIYRSVLDGKARYYGDVESAEYVKNAGEPYRFGIEEDSIEDYLLIRGFRIVEHLKPIDLQNRFLLANRQTLGLHSALL